MLPSYCDRDIHYPARESWSRAYPTATVIQVIKSGSEEVLIPLMQIGAGPSPHKRLSICWKPWGQTATLEICGEWWGKFMIQRSDPRGWQARRIDYGVHEECEPEQTGKLLCIDAITYLHLWWIRSRRLMVMEPIMSSSTNSSCSLSSSENINIEDIALCHPFNQSRSNSPFRKLVI